MTAFLQEDEPKVFQNARKGFLCPLGEVGVVVAMYCQYRTLDFLTKLQQFPTGSQFFKSFLYILINIKLVFQ